MTLLPNGGALHRWQSAVTYDKEGCAFNRGSAFDASGRRRRIVNA